MAAIAAKIDRAIIISTRVKPFPRFSSVRPERVEGPFFLSAPPEEGRCFDKLSTNGRKGDADLRLAALTALFAPLHEINRAPPSIPRDRMDSAASSPAAASPCRSRRGGFRSEEHTSNSSH